MRRPANHPIRLFRIGNCDHTPFAVDNKKAEAFFAQNRITYSSNLLKCDLFVAGGFFPQNWNKLSKKLLLWCRYQWRRPILVWTDEPWNTESRPRVSWSLLQPPAHYMTPYTGDIFSCNYHFNWAIREPVRLKNPAECRAGKDLKIVGLMSYVPSPQARLFNGENRDLNVWRMEFLLAGLRRSQVHVYGPGWPAGMSREDSREGNWWQKKIKILQDYDICLAVENTHLPFYCSEKIWQAIQGGCLPIYYGRNSRIYDDFPRNSFIDASEFKHPGEVYDYINTLTAEDYAERYNKCAATFNGILETQDFDEINRAPLVAIVDRIRRIA